ncbi:GNAT family N-acetyltransferase [Bacillus sp. Cr_A10]|uniref:GNAT family N-acetyltransferase n=1 Tax=Bacillus sp. Cr_A10 TaxID=3033993 RepID=UPI0023DA6497|nr:GNAT family N-acetyltransferase [Bacillus sp. Cr_A10]MDF2066957.1 GNAT family N-acetyltransferase [Bacillus sp. Cr_A10]
MYQTLLSDFSVLESSNSFIVAYENKEILGAISLYIDEENKQAEVWGPYVYVEADPKHGEGLIEYVSVNPEFQKQGVGTKLVRVALNHLIFKDSLNEITLCVGAENQKAVHLYKAYGFQVKHELTYFKKEIPST